jgi:hypothetical protein
MKRLIILTNVILKGITRAHAKRSLFNDPKNILIINLIIFALIFFPLYLFLSIKKIDLFLPKLFLNEVIVNIPFFMFIMFIFVGVLLIFEAGESIFNVETINWVPIKSYEYVLANVISTMYIYSFPSFMLLALIIPILIIFQLYPLILIFIFALLAAIFMALLFVEIIKIFLEISFTKLKKLKGKFILNLRLALVIIVSSSFIVFTNPSLIQNLLFNTKIMIELGWFLPFNWPSNSLKFYIEGNYFGTYLNILSTIFFCFSLLYVVSYLRSMYWVIEKPSIIIEKRQHKNILNIKMKQNTINVLVSKDFKAYTRKIELIKTYAPIFGLIILSFIISSSYLISLVIPTIIALILSTVAIGYEGKAIINLYYLPISYKEFYKSKLILIFIFSLFLSLITILNIYFILYLDLFKLLIIFYLIFLICFLASKIGLTIGLKYPKFEETRLSKMLSIKGAYLSLIVGGIFYIIAILMVWSILRLQNNSILFLILVFSLLYYFIYKIFEKINFNLSKKLLEDVSKI